MADAKALSDNKQSIIKKQINNLCREGMYFILAFLPVFFLLLTLGHVASVGFYFTLIAVLLAGGVLFLRYKYNSIWGKIIAATLMALGSLILLHVSYIPSRIIFLSWEWFNSLYTNLSGGLASIVGNGLTDGNAGAAGGILVIFLSVFLWGIFYGRYYSGNGIKLLTYGLLFQCVILAMCFQVALFLILYTASVIIGFFLENNNKTFIEDRLGLSVNSFIPQQVRPGSKMIVGKFWDYRLVNGLVVFLIIFLLAYLLSMVWHPPTSTWQSWFLNVLEKGGLIFLSNDLPLQIEKSPFMTIVWIVSEITLLLLIPIVIVKWKNVNTSGVLLGIGCFVVPVFILRGIFSGGYLPGLPPQAMLSLLKVGVYILIVVFFSIRRPHLTPLVAVILFIIPILVSSSGGLSETKNMLPLAKEGLPSEETVYQEEKSGIISDSTSLLGFNEAFLNTFSIDGYVDGQLHDFENINPRAIPGSRQDGIIFTVDADRPYYWRQTTLEYYSGDEWRRERGTLYSFSSGENINEEIGLSRRKDKIAVTPLVHAPVIPYAGELQRVDSPRFRYTLDHTGRLRPGRVIKAGERVEMVCSITTVSPNELRKNSGSENTYPSSIKERYLQLPPQLPSGVEELTFKVVGNSENNYDIAVKIALYLSENYLYEDNPPMPPAGEDWMAFFLLKSKIGKCDYFAGAMALMARVAGLPTRVAVGYAPGTYRDERFLVSSANAHAWVEVYFNWYGWIPFEPSPPTAIPSGSNLALLELTSNEHSISGSSELMSEQVGGFVEDEQFSFFHNYENGEYVADVGNDEVMSDRDNGVMVGEEEVLPGQEIVDVDAGYIDKIDENNTAYEQAPSQEDDARLGGDSYVIISILIRMALFGLFLLLVACIIAWVPYPPLVKIKKWILIKLKILWRGLTGYLPGWSRYYIYSINTDRISQKYYRKLASLGRNFPRLNSETPREYLLRLVIAVEKGILPFEAGEIKKFALLTAKFERVRYCSTNRKKKQEV